jgi:hypothetical protein
VSGLIIGMVCFQWCIEKGLHWEWENGFVWFYWCVNNWGLGFFIFYKKYLGLKDGVTVQSRPPAKNTSGDQI